MTPNTIVPLECGGISVGIGPYTNGIDGYKEPATSFHADFRISEWQSVVAFGTLGFALAKGLIRGLTRCQPVLVILVYYPFLDVSWRSPCVSATGTLRRCTS